jgi:hypothetical protein
MFDDIVSTWWNSRSGIAGCYILREARPDRSEVSLIKRIGVPAQNVTNKFICAHAGFIIVYIDATHKATSRGAQSLGTEDIDMMVFAKCHSGFLTDSDELDRIYMASRYSAPRLQIVKRNRAISWVDGKSLCQLVPTELQKAAAEVATSDYRSGYDRNRAITHVSYALSY